MRPCSRKKVINLIQPESAALSLREENPVGCSFLAKSISVVGQECNLKKERRTGVVYLSCSRTGAGVHPNYAQSLEMDFMLLGTEALTPCMAKIALVI